MRARGVPLLGPPALLLNGLVTSAFQWDRDAGAMVALPAHALAAPAPQVAASIAFDRADASAAAPSSLVAAAAAAMGGAGTSTFTGGGSGGADSDLVRHTRTLVARESGVPADSAPHENRRAFVPPKHHPHREAGHHKTPPFRRLPEYAIAMSPSGLKRAQRALTSPYPP